jgi:CheY-like chemotaxis protein
MPHTLHVLVAEDNAVNQQVMAHYLTDAGCVFEIVPDGLQAVERVKSGDFDLVLMDIQMPVMDGVAATLAIRSLDCPNRGIPIIAVTAHTGPDLEASYLRAGMNAVLGKPLKPAALAEVMQSLGRARAAASRTQRS